MADDTEDRAERRINPNTRLTRAIGLTVILMMAGLAVACGEVPTQEEVLRGAAGRASANAKFLQSIQEFAMGERAIVGQFAMTVNGARISDGRNAGLAAPILDDGTVYFLVSVTLENIGGEPGFVSSRMLMNLFDSNGNTQRWTVFPDSRGSIDGRIAPGQERRGELVWEVAEGTVGLKLVFDETAFAVGDAIVGASSS